ncbi:MAG: UDP-N-acetylglucosamine--N-acetylmuramyl-(pentapeptide) pyrophosphoryl-undecaprenol N-acetylglucosamine transferase [Silanimonas sp.]|nr:MAG: UDP-N-acetylglucosamine--N-acetylmuramyl-(pentapeptide) pyrophosphoryl-undecaprenol N-acetylglucosamine transferase [Silanimonas sp.]
MSAPRFTVMAGGTGGHIFPALAVARVLRERGGEVCWMGSAGGMEERLVAEAGFPLDVLPIGALRGKGAIALLAAPWRVGRAVAQARSLLRRQTPRAVLAFGGFASGPGGLAACSLGLPLIVHEQNRAPGLTNRVLARLARRVLTGFPGTFPAPAEAVGNPVRPAIAALPDPDSRLRGRSGPVRVLVLGGSQGARGLNLAVPKALAGWMNLEIRHQCGEKLVDEARAAYAVSKLQARIEPFITDMAEAYAWADLVISRAGASTLAELCAAGVGSVLVPFPQAVDDHQARNAEFMAEGGASLWLRQTEALASELAECLKPLLGDRRRLLEMAQAARRLALPRAAERVADIAFEEACR